MPNSPGIPGHGRFAECCRADGFDVGQVIPWYRNLRNPTQQEAAVLLTTEQSRLSKIEKGAPVLLGIGDLRYVAEKLDIPAGRLGVPPDRSHESVPYPSHVS